MAKGRGQKVNRRDLASVFGVSLPTIDAWVAAGCPYDQRGARGEAWVFDTADVAHWREQRAADEAGGTDVVDDVAIKRRKAKAELRLIELELLQKTGQLAPVEQMERALSRVLTEVQSNLRGSFIARLAQQLIGETDERTFKRIALSEVDSTLKSLAEIDVTADEPEAPVDDDDA